VQFRVEPLLYRVIALNAPFPGFPLFTDDIMSSLIDRKSPKFFHDTVRHLITFRRSKVEDTILTLCTGVEDLYLCFEFRADIFFLEIIQSPPFTRLYARKVRRLIRYRNLHPAISEGSW
jgi:hypothetical protein